MKYNVFGIIAVIVIIFFFFFLIFSPLGELKEWRSIYNRLDEFSYYGDSMFGNLIFHDGDGRTEIWVGSKVTESFVCYDGEVVLSTVSNLMMSYKVAKALLKKNPGLIKPSKKEIAKKAFKERYSTKK